MFVDYMFMVADHCAKFAFDKTVYIFTCLVQYFGDRQKAHLNGCAELFSHDVMLSRKKTLI